MTDWNELISDVVAGNWKDPTTGKTATVPFEVIRIEEDLDGGEADVLAPLKLGRRIAVVSDVNTHEAMAKRVAKHLKALGTIEELVLPGNTHCDEPTIAIVTGALDKPHLKEFAPRYHSYVSRRPRWWHVSSDHEPQ